MSTKVLDNGSVELLGVFGSELTIVNAARVSFGKESDKFSNKDMKLLKYLHDNNHMSPFRHVMLRFRIIWPEFVARQAYKHIVGIEGSTSVKDSAWNEISGRYMPVHEFHTPTSWRSQSKSSKQGSGGVVSSEMQYKCSKIYEESLKTIKDAYDNLIKMGIAKEQARVILPLSQYTQVIWTCSAQALYNFITLRMEPHAQSEIRDYALVMRQILQKALPYLYGVWFPLHMDRELPTPRDLPKNTKIPTRDIPQHPEDMS